MLSFTVLTVLISSSLCSAEELELMKSTNSHQLTSNSSNCFTVGGDKPGLPCILPFSIGNGALTFNGCFWRNDLQQFICSTKVDATGNNVIGHTGFCSDACPKLCVIFLSWPCNGKCIPIGE